MGSFFTCLAPGGGNLHDLPTFLVDPCAHVVFALRIIVYMIPLNMSIDVTFKTFRYCTTTRRILIQSICIGPKHSINVAFSLSSVNKVPFHNDGVPS